MLSIRVDPPEQTIDKNIGDSMQDQRCQSLTRMDGPSPSTALSRKKSSRPPERFSLWQEAEWSVRHCSTLKTVDSNPMVYGPCIFDDTELKVQAQLLDRPAGLPGLLGQEASNEDEALQRKPSCETVALFSYPEECAVRS